MPSLGVESAILQSLARRSNQLSYAAAYIRKTSELLRIGRDANQIPIRNSTDELCDNIFCAYSKNCMKCDYLDPNKTNHHTKTLTNLMITYNPYHSYLASYVLSESCIKNQPQVNIELAGENFINISLESNAGRE